ncbi:hypothetical protein EII19_10365 [Comamonadaceae bacterium OH2310_COT-174]|nr:hypothetical protein EII19_10365 [Comamonadaceae bacterium OH2310_COT-174]
MDDGVTVLASNALADLAQHLPMHDAVFVECGKNEMRYAKDPFAAITDHGRTPGTQAGAAWHGLTLRDDKPQAVMQQIWGALLACTLVRLEMAKVPSKKVCRPRTCALPRL